MSVSYLLISDRKMCPVPRQNRLLFMREKLPRSSVETEAIERALDFVIAEHEKNHLVLQTAERFIKSGIQTKDVYSTLVG